MWSGAPAALWEEGEELGAVSHSEKYLYWWGLSWSRWLFLNPYIWNSWGHWMRTPLPMTNIKGSLFLFVDGGLWTVTLVMERLMVVLSLEGIVENAAMWRVFGVQNLLWISTPMCWAWFGVWFGPTVQMCIMKSIKFYDFRSHTGLWDHNVTQGPRRVMIARWLVGVIHILFTQNEVHRPAPSSASSGSLLEMQDLRSHSRPTTSESPGDLYAQQSVRSAGLYPLTPVLHSSQHLMSTHCVHCAECYGYKDE